MPFADDDLEDSRPAEGQLSYDEVRSECDALGGQLWEDRRFFGDQVSPVRGAAAHPAAR